MAYSSIKVARYLLELGKADTRSLTPLDLIKLTYLAHGWSLGLRGQPLVAENAEAWQYGPVFSDLYRKLKHYRASPVTEIRSYPGEVVEDDLSDEDKSLIQAVYNAYKAFNGVQLSAMTHQQGTPWDEAWRQRGKNTQIKDDKIREHYQRLARQRQSQTA